MGVSMLASSAFSQSSRCQSRKSPGGGPPALLTRISTCAQAANTCSRTAGSLMSPATVRTSMPGASWRNSSAAACKVSLPRALITRLTPSFAKARAQASPSPLLAAQTIAQRPVIPNSMTLLLLVECEENPRGFLRYHCLACANDGSMPAGDLPCGRPDCRRKRSVSPINVD
ncbi:hypothetical protein D3C85_1404560 [compost metagenome]